MYETYTQYGKDSVSKKEKPLNDYGSVNAGNFYYGNIYIACKILNTDKSLCSSYSIDCLPNEKDIVFEQNQSSRTFSFNQIFNSDLPLVFMLIIHHSIFRIKFLKPFLPISCPP